MSREDRLKRFFQHTKDPDDWMRDYAKMIAFVEREGGVTVTEQYSHSKLLYQAKIFAELRKEEFEIIGKMLGAVK